MLSHAQLLDAIPHALHAIDLPALGKKAAGKVRDSYPLPHGRRLLITTDRVSAFDLVLGVIPYRGQVLNQLSAWWFEHTENIVANHMVITPDPNVMVVYEAEPLPVEVVVRGYITGVTQTALWTRYAAGDRRPYGIPLPDGLKQNDPLPEPIITPTTKAAPGQHDQPLTRQQILDQRLVAPDLWRQVEEAALTLFRHGQSIARGVGLTLVDTKYEFGLVNGELALIDEFHTPDSSRFWDDNNQHFDKEYLRHWYAERGYRGEGQPPIMPPDFIAEVAARYITVFERLTGTTFSPGETPVAERIAQNVVRFVAT